MDQQLYPLNLRELILNTRKPIVLKNFKHQWTCFENGLDKWCELYDAHSPETPEFERIALGESSEPQWERKRQQIRISATEFLHDHSSERNYWSGLNYKRKNDIPEECSKGVDFGCFGFPHATDDCTFWLSSKGANTPCHYDTYGCNIVVQVFGRKSWLLFPPSNTVLTPTRIPYEESSVYCKENFYAPNSKEFTQLEQLKGQSYQCILEPNDVLIVPRHWWHYVEALEISLNVNAWIPLTCDIDNQIEECITKHIMETFIRNSSDDIKSFVMNPNHLSAIAKSEELFNILEYLLEQKLSEDVHKEDAKKSGISHRYHYLNESEFTAIKHSIRNLFEVPIIADDEWVEYLRRQSSRYHSKSLLQNEQDSVYNSLSHIQEAMLNSLCSPNVVNAIKVELLNRYNKQNKNYN
ncbi:HSPB1-associated protein 1 [Musca vetustissima]|uniref:HSPB1-associated protein 1 n=1 Tax=Musca vetustissima TaxID=27455 RepID=UPI002AB6CC38|nr:HSPB1-associated protein 1 [Musca vetustissima]